MRDENSHGAIQSFNNFYTILFTKPNSTIAQEIRTEIVHIEFGIIYQITS